MRSVFSLGKSLATLSMLLLAFTADAHHSFATTFDREKPLDVTGTVTSVQWTNPHTWLYVDIENEDGAVENWAFEMGSPSGLRRKGWSRNTIQDGDEIRIVGFRARDDSLRGAAASVTLPTGESLTGQDTSGN